MTSRRLLMAVAVSMPLALTTSALAHHSFAAQFDRDKPVTLNGAMTRLEWMNPHIYFYMDVKDQSGAITKWSIEGGAPNTLYRAGWRKDTIKIGEILKVEGFLARDGSKLASLNTVTTSDGRRVFSQQP
jgi:hypothetical protein